MQVFLMIVSGLLIVLTLLQSGSSDGITAAFTGSSDLSLFSVTKERGSDKVLTQITTVLVVVFFALIIYLNFVG